jgi:hypothetical protein
MRAIVVKLSPIALIILLTMRPPVMLASSLSEISGIKFSASVNGSELLDRRLEIEILAIEVLLAN